VFRVRRVYDDVLPRDRHALAQVREILRAQFPGAPQADVETLAERLRNPFRYRFRTLLFVADDLAGHVKGFALASHEPMIGFVFLDYLASGARLTGRGIGGSLYQALRDEARALRVVGIFCECAPDLPEEVDDPETLRQNASRLRFYERFGARPIEHTDYRAPIQPGDRGLPFLVFDPIDRDRRCGAARRAKWCGRCSSASTRPCARPRTSNTWWPPSGTTPWSLRAPRLPRTEALARPAPNGEPPIPIVVNEAHQIHHVRDRGYVEAPVRVSAILSELERTGSTGGSSPSTSPTVTCSPCTRRSWCRTCAAAASRCRRASRSTPTCSRSATRQGRRSRSRCAPATSASTPSRRSPQRLPGRPRAVDCALTAAARWSAAPGSPTRWCARPATTPSTEVFGGFCYFNNTAIAAQYLSSLGRVAILDIDYHHGNGQQNIFYARDDVLTLSIHGHPRFAYPYFSGFEDERGWRAGEGFN
jgi:GNAT superfamily N-acetyltransferase